MTLASLTSAFRLRPCASLANGRVSLRRCHAPENEGRVFSSGKALGAATLLIAGLLFPARADILDVDAVNPVVGLEPPSQSGTALALRESDTDGSGGFTRPVDPPLHRGKSQIRVVSSGAYQAVVQIFDQFAQPVTSFTHHFDPESENRAFGGHYLSYLTWNLRSENGYRVGNGVYIWRISFVQGSGKLPKTLYRTIGVLRDGES